MKLIIDGDVLLYQSLPRDSLSSFPLATETYIRLKEQMIRNTFADEVVLCMSTEGANFRKNEYPSYKAQRKIKEKPPHLFDLKDWAWIHDPDIIGSPKGEADDYMLIEAAKCIKAGETFVIASVDKDLRTIPCPYYNMLERKIYKIDADYALDFIFEQFITGDAIDGIAGIYGMGPRKTTAYLETFNTNKEKWDGIKSKWREVKGDGWKEAFNQDCNLVLIRRYKAHLRTLDFAGMSWNVLRKMLGFHIPD